MPFGPFFYSSFTIENGYLREKRTLEQIPRLGMHQPIVMQM